MSDRPSVLVTLDGEVCDPAEPLLHADDLAAVRGDGIFETLLVRAGKACLVESHLRRLVSSAAMLELPVPDLAVWRRAIEIAVSQWSAQTADEGALRLVNVASGHQVHPVRVEQLLHPGQVAVLQRLLTAAPAAHPRARPASRPRRR